MTRILIVAPAWVGDAVLAQPLFMRLRERTPGATLDVVAPAWTLPVFRRMPQVAAAIAGPFAHGELGLGARWRLARTLAARGYDRAIVLPNSWKSALVPFLAGIPVRTGYVGEARYGLLNDARRLDESALPQMAERFAHLADAPGTALARQLPELALASTPAQREATLQRLALTLERPVACLCPGAEYGPAKRWPSAHFASLAGELYAREPLPSRPSSRSSGRRKIPRPVRARTLTDSPWSGASPPGGARRIPAPRFRRLGC